MNRSIIYIALVILLGFSCNSRETYFQFNELDATGWSNRDTIYFEIDSALIDIEQKYDIMIESVNNTDYLYQNLWLYIFADIDNTNQAKVEKEYYLADTDGKWNGNGFGTLYELSLPYKQNVIFPEKRNYQIKIIHGMIDQPLFGIEKIGIRLIPSHIE